MTRTDLSQLQSLKKEIEILKNQIASINPGIVTDSVKGSSIRFPYTQHSILITGVDYKAFDAKVKSLTRQLHARVDELMDKVREINEYIATVEDSDTRSILQCKYINGLTWEQIEAETGLNERTAKRKFSRWCDT